MPDWVIIAVALAPILGGVCAFIYSVKGKADSANAKGSRALVVADALETRVRSAETAIAVNTAETSSLCERVDEIRNDVKQLLERVPRR